MIINEFNSISLVSKKIDIDSFIKKFVLDLAKNKSARSIITASYSFILEFSERYEMLNLRSKEGGALEPILTHLFKGGLIFESLLKAIYIGDDNDTIESFNNDTQFKSDFNNYTINTTATSLKEIINSINNKNDYQTAFDTTARLRNTTGHNLSWDDIFNDPENYKKLYQQVINAILYIVAKRIEKT